MTYKNTLEIEQGDQKAVLNFYSTFALNRIIENIIVENDGMKIKLTSFDSDVSDVVPFVIEGSHGVATSENDEYTYYKYLNSHRIWDIPTSFKGNKEFFLERARTMSAKFSVASDIGDASESLQNDVDFILELMKFNYRVYMYTPRVIRRNILIIEEFLKVAKQHEIGGHCPMEDRITVAYELCKKYPLYESKLSEGLKKKIGSMSIVEYVEKRNLKNSLQKELPKKAAPAKSMKI